MNNLKDLKEKIYEIVDSFLVEAKNQYGKERSLERLNQDRHLAVDALISLFEAEKKKIEGKIRKAIDKNVAKNIGIQWGTPQDPLHINAKTYIKCCKWWEDMIKKSIFESKFKSTRQDKKGV